MNHWELVLPPSRPSATQLARIEGQLAGLERDSKVAILGSTPEFRDLLYECGFRRIYVLERNPFFHQLTTAMLVHPVDSVLIRGDWLDTLPELAGMFSVILSDLTSGNIAYEDRARFYEYVEAALVSGGFFVDKVLTHSQPHILLEPLVEKYRTLPVNLLHVNQFSCEALFCSELLNLANIVDTTQFYQILEDRFDEPRIRCFAANSKRITPPGFVWWYGLSWSELEAHYCPQLTRLAVHEDEANSPYYGRVKHFLLAKSR